MESKVDRGKELGEFIQSMVLEYYQKAAIFDKV